MKNKTFLDSIKCSINGIMIAYKQEKNFKIYSIIALFFLIINMIVGIETIHWIVYIVICFVTFSAECINTAIEKTCDFITTDMNDSIKEIKDIAAGGVLYTGILYFLVEGIIIYLNL